jgi:hypothetical protein
VISKAIFYRLAFFQYKLKIGKGANDKKVEAENGWRLKTPAI